MISPQSAYFDIKKHRFPSHYIFRPLCSQLMEMYHLEHSLDLPPKSHLIDFGCGSGRLSLYFLSLGYSVLAIDISRKSLNELVWAYKQIRQKDWGRLTVATHLPRKNYDGIIGSDILHHTDINEILPRLHRVLKPGGKVAFSEPNAISIFWYLYYLIYRIPWNIEKGILQNIIFNIGRKFKKYHFRNIRTIGHGLFPTRVFNFSSSLCRLNCLKLGNLPLLRPLAYRFIITAGK